MLFNIRTRKLNRWKNEIRNIAGLWLANNGNHRAMPRILGSLMDRDLNILIEVTSMRKQTRLRPEDKLGFALAAINAASISDPEIAQEASKIIDALEKEHEGIITDSDIRSELWKQDGIPGLGPIVPSSGKFLRDTLFYGEKAPEEGANAPYQRPSDAEIWKRHCEDCTGRGKPSPKVGSSVLTKDEAKFYTKRGFFPEDWVLRFENKRGLNNWDKG